MRALRLVLIEGWGERLGSMGREWTRFERMADQRGAAEIAGRIAFIAAAQPSQMPGLVEPVPRWLHERIERAYDGRLDVGEAVTEAESARDQVAAFRVLVVRHRPDLAGPWLALPDPDLNRKLAELDHLIAEICTPVS